MERFEAIERYIKCNKEPKFTIKKIRDWDGTKTIRVNAERLLMSSPQALIFAKRYHLSYIRYRDTNNKNQKLYA